MNGEEDRCRGQYLGNWDSNRETDTYSENVPDYLRDLMLDQVLQDPARFSEELHTVLVPEDVSSLQPGGLGHQEERRGHVMGLFK